MGVAPVRHDPKVNVSQVAMGKRSTALPTAAMKSDSVLSAAQNRLINTETTCEGIDVYPFMSTPSSNNGGESVKLMQSDAYGNLCHTELR